MNGLESRRGRKELDVNNVIYWFKNTRAAVKRQMMKDKSTTFSTTKSFLEKSFSEVKQSAPTPPSIK